MSGMFTSTPESVIGQQTLEAHFPADPATPQTSWFARDSRTKQRARQLSYRASSPSRSRAADGWIQLSAVLTDATDSDAAKATVTRLRAAVHDIDGADALVGGSTAIELDTELPSSGTNAS